MKLSATHLFNCIVLMVKFGRTSCGDIIPLALYDDYFLVVIIQPEYFSLSEKRKTLMAMKTLTECYKVHEMKWLNTSLHIVLKCVL